MTELTLENVTYRYKGANRNVVDSANCTFEGGRLNAVVGPSGSGKTTLLSLMAGLDQPTQGSIAIDGEDLANLDLDQYRRERISMIFQAFQLFPLLTVLENVCFPLELNGAPRKEAAEWAESFLTAVGIDEGKYRRFPANLSGGEQQRVAIARSLASGARVLLADEPTGNLDKANGENVVEILQRLAYEQGYCVIIVTHDLQIAGKAGKLWKMTDGTLTEIPLLGVGPRPAQP